ncbi:MAG: M28 family peptidase [Holophagales bacterium]|jgi:hypothetical protein|nr:M28 family peptidase [Holophagales bacterium]
MRYLLCGVLTVALAAQSPAEQRFTKDINYLASPKLEGRGNGGKGLEDAADYIQETYKKLELKVERQTFPFVYKVERDNASCALAGKELIFGKDIETFGSSGDGNFKNAPVLFAGFGLKVLGWNDFSGNDPKDKVVAITRKIPDIDAVKGVAKSDLELYSRIRRISNLGALAVVVLEDSPTPTQIKREEGPLTQPIPVLSLPMTVLDGAWGNVKEALDSITTEPVTKILPGMAMDLNVRMRQVTAHLPNLTAVLPGSDPVLSEDYIVVGAHMDHIGMGERYSRGGTGQSHPGADDNASGTAMVMELARRLKTTHPKRSILFVHFSGEEEGLLGSAHWIQYPTVPIPSVKFMVNFDMVGRLDKEKPVLHVGGLGATKAILEHSRGLAPNDFAIGSDLGFAMGGSDHMSFASARIPSYFFFTGIHTDYHTPKDTADKLNIHGMAYIADYAAKVLQDLADRPELPDFDPTTAQINARQTSAAGRRIAFGTVPDFTESKDGFRITGTTSGSTAEGIGLKTGDRIISFGGKSITDIYDFMEALGTFKGGDKVIIKWIRDGQEQQAEAILRER